MNVAQETLGLRREGFSPSLSLLMSAFALPIPPADLSIYLRRRTERSPTARAFRRTHRTRSFGVQFEPRYIFRAGRLDQ
jgi:hypothetical protein